MNKRKIVAFTRVTRAIELHINKQPEPSPMEGYVQVIKLDEDEAKTLYEYLGDNLQIIKQEK